LAFGLHALIKGCYNFRRLQAKEKLQWIQNLVKVAVCFAAAIFVRISPLCMLRILTNGC